MSREKQNKLIINNSELFVYGIVGVSHVSCQKKLVRAYVGHAMLFV